MKSVILFLLSVVFVGCIGCSKCDGSNPSIRVINNGTAKLTITFKASNGKTTSFTNIEKEYVTDYKTIPSGNTLINYSIDTVNISNTYNFKTCKEYNVTVDEDNQLVFFSHDLK